MATKLHKGDTGEILEIVNFIKDHMVENMMTKDEGASKVDILRVEDRLLSIEQELKDIKQRLSTLEKELRGIDTKYKEDIEELWKRVIAIERKLKVRA